MRLLSVITLASAFALSGCSLNPGARIVPTAAEYQMHVADSLEQEGLLQIAARRYAFVAEQYPQSSFYPSAVRRAALLFSVSPYAETNDSAAYRWYLAYLALPLQKPERENVRVSVDLLRRVLLLHAQIAQLYTVADSLTVLAKKQSTLITADSHRMQEVELELQAAQSELKKIKEIDLKLSKSRAR